ncbi:MAG TPA: GNAT family N-acetyltransferase [Bryobacteraceae bacterium]|nr:GNAT family N-acetyltransferase [Bryobacteraceae bacterium]
MRALVVHEHDRVIGIVPLVVRGQTVGFWGSPESDCNDVLCGDPDAPRVLEAALDFLLQSPLRWKSGLLDNLPSQSRIVRAIPALPSSIRQHLQLVFRCPAPTIMIGQNTAQVLDPLINKDQLKRYDRKLQTRGRVRFRHLGTREEVREHLACFFHQHITRWAMSGMRSDLIRPERRAFFEALVEELDPRTELRFGVLELDSRPIAYHFGLQIAGRLIWYKPTFDVNYWELCPGDVLLRNLFQYARDARLDEFDFSVGDEPFKYRFANGVRHNYALHLESHPAHMRSRVTRIARRAEHLVRQKPEWKAALKSKAYYLIGIGERFRRLVTPEAPLRNCLYGLRRMYRRTIWGRDEALFYIGMETPLFVNSRIELTEGSLGALASLSAQHSGALSGGDLQEYRRRLKFGDRAFIARTPQEEVFILWVGHRSEIAVPEIGPDCNLRLRSAVSVLYECRPVRADPAGRVPSAILRAVAAYFRRNRLWIYSTGDDGPLKQAIEDAGFRLRHRRFHYASLRAWIRARLTRCEATPAFEEEEAVERVSHASL